MLLHLVRRVIPDALAVFVDTGLEYPELRHFAMNVDNVKVIKPEMNFKKVIETYGYPLISKEVSEKIYYARKGGYCVDRFDPDSDYNKKYGGQYSMVKWNFLKDSDIPISNMCCMVMKKRPAKKFEHQSGLKPIIGTMAEESRLRKQQWLANGCNAFDGVRAISTPMSFWTEQDVLQYIKRYNLDYAPVYGRIVEENGKLKTTGCYRTGCVYCAYGAHLQKDSKFKKLKVTHPTIWHFCMKDKDKGGLGMRHPLEFIGVETGWDDNEDYSNMKNGGLKSREELERLFDLVNNED